MLIHLERIDSKRELEYVLQYPAEMENGVLYVTSHPDCAKALAAGKLPCIFLENAEDTASDVYGVDLIIAEDDPVQDGEWQKDQEMLLGIWKRHYEIPWTIAETERLLIRETIMEDLPYLLAIYKEESANTDVKPFSAEPEAELRAYIKHQYPFYGYGLWTVVEKASGHVAGRVGFEHMELSYLIGEKFRHQGYAREAAWAVLFYAKERLGFPGVSLRTSPENSDSRKLAVSLGFQSADDDDNFFRLDLTSR